MDAPGVSIEAALPAAEKLLVDFARLVAQGRADEALDRLQRAVSTKQGRRKSLLTDGGRAVLSLVLAERRANAAGTARGSFRAAVSHEERVDEAISNQSVRTPVMPDVVDDELARVISEYERQVELKALGLAPTRTILLSGPPGTGKSMTMLYLAAALGRPLVRVEPSDVIGSYLGESARSLVEAFAAARSSRAVLGLDEIDALAKRRDDTQDVGEFKRFVSTLLLELDRWRGETPVIAATNHLDLLDPALDRRFELHIQLELPTADAREKMIEGLCREYGLECSPSVLAALVSLSEGLSGAAVVQGVERAARRMVLDGLEPESALMTAMGNHPVARHADRARVAVAARAAGMTYREIGSLLHCSHTAARNLAEAGKGRGTKRA